MRLGEDGSGKPVAKGRGVDSANRPGADAWVGSGPGDAARAVRGWLGPPGAGEAHLQGISDPGASSDPAVESKKALQISSLLQKMSIYICSPFIKTLFGSLMKHVFPWDV